MNGSFLNEGTLAATGGGTLDVDALKDSIGTASATAGGHLDIDGTFTNFLDRTLDGSHCPSAAHGRMRRHST